MADNSSFKAIEAIVERANSGGILFLDDFITCGTSDAVRTGLSRLCRNRKLNRFAKGIYFYAYNQPNALPKQPLAMVM